MGDLRRFDHVVLAAILLLAAVLRFTGIDHGLRRGEPLADEAENFIQPVLGMWDNRSPDPNVHAGYPGFFNYVAFLPMGAGRKLVDWNGAALGGRALVAAFGTLNVFLIFSVLRPVWGPWAALFGAALLAVSRSEVSEAHAITPDILVVTAFLATALSLQSPRARTLWPGVWAGLGVAIKHSGVILFPALLAELAVRRELRRRLIPLLAVAGLALVLAAPYAVIFRKGQPSAGRSVQYYSAGLQGDVAAGVATRAGRALRWTWENLGAVGSILALAGLALGRPRRALVFPAAVLVTTVLVVATPRALGPFGQVFPRHVLLAGAASAVLAAAGYAALARRPAVAVGLALIALAQPALRSARITAGYARPDELERAALWIEGQGRPVTVATSLETFRMEPPVELRNDLDVAHMPADALARYDFVLAPRAVAAGLAGLAAAAVFEEPGNPDGGLAVLRPAAPPADAAWPRPVETSGTAPGAERAFDGDRATAWSAPAGPGWLEALWDRPREIRFLEVVAEAGDERWPQRLTVLGRRGTGDWAPLDVVALRPTRTRRQNPPHGQVFLVTDPRSVDGLRIERGDGRDWGLAEVRASGPPN